MKRTAILGLVTALLVVPAAASALDTTTGAVSSGKAKGFSVGFKVDSTGGEPVNVRKFKFKNLKMNCDQGKVLLSGKNVPDMAVTADHFEGHFTSGGGDVDIDGDFNTKATKVEGTVAADGTFPNNNGGGNFTGCDGSKNYTAK